MQGRERSHGDDDDPWGEFPTQEEVQGSEGDYDIEGRSQGAGADRADPSGDENPDDGGIDPAQDGLHGRTLAKVAPERQDGDDGEQAGKEDGDKSEKCVLTLDERASGWRVPTFAKSGRIWAT